MVAKKTRSPVIKNDPFEAFDESASEVSSEQPETAVAPKAKVKAKAKSKPRAKPKAKAKPKVKAKSEPKVQVEVEPEPEPEVERVMTAEVSSEGSQIELGSSFGIQEVSEVMGEIKSALDLGSPIVLNGGDVERIDAAGLQLLCMLLKSGGEKGTEVSWASASTVMVESARQLGLQEILQMPSSEHSS